MRGSISVKKVPMNVYGNTEWYAPLKDKVQATSGPQWSRLPAEIRNNISELTVVTGKIHIPLVIEAMNATLEDSRQDLNARRQQSEHKSSNRSRACYLAETSFAAIVRMALKMTILDTVFIWPQGSPVGLLAASSQTYQESCWSYWSQNTFYLPRGPVQHTQLFWDFVTPEHKALVRSIGIRFSLADLTPAVVDFIEHDARVWAQRDGHTINTLEDVPDIYWRHHIRGNIRHSWENKLHWISKWEGLDEIRLETPGQEVMVIPGSEVRKLASGAPILPGHLRARELNIRDEEVRHFIVRAIIDSSAFSSGLIMSGGWRLFKKTIGEMLREESRET